MKVGIFSYNKYSLYMNFGAALHSFAFQKALEKKGIESAIVDYRSKHVEDFDFNNLFLTDFRRGKIKGAKSFITSLINTGSLRTKYKKFLRFYENHCIMYSDNGSAFYYSRFLTGDYNNFPFSTVVCESDVTWSPLTNEGFDRVLFFDFECFESINKVAYSPSISNTVLTDEQESEFKRLLGNYDSLSSREDDTAKYVTELVSRPCAWVLDPVLLLTLDDYRPYIQDMQFEGYVLLYNCMKNDKNLIKQAQELATEKNLKLIEISDYNQNKFQYGHTVLTNLGIEEFLGMFNNATYIVTNGFHGACFALIFNKEFYLFARDGLDIKIRSLLRMVNLESRYVPLGGAIDVSKPPIDYQSVNSRLAEERKSSFNYIVESMK